VAFDKNWTRWIFASFSKHFESKRQGIPMYFEGDLFDPSKDQTYFEFRVNGPSCWELPGNVWYFKIEINILIVHKKVEGGNVHRLHEVIGIAAAMFDKNITIKKYGAGPDDNRDEVLDCATYTQDDDEPVAITHLGQVDPNVKEMQAMVEATYQIYHEE
jgi:hypothetical protein